MKPYEIQLKAHKGYRIIEKIIRLTDFQSYSRESEDVYRGHDYLLVFCLHKASVFLQTLTWHLQRHSSLSLLTLACLPLLYIHPSPHLTFLILSLEPSNFLSHFFSFSIFYFFFYVTYLLSFTLLCLSL